MRLLEDRSLFPRRRLRPAMKSDTFCKMYNLPTPADTPSPNFRTKRELAIGTLRDAIQTGRYVPGQPLRQTQLMADLGLGSTPVRDAMLEMLARGVLVQESHHSVRVAELDLPRLRSVYHVRCLLEMEAARLGTANLSAAGLATMKVQLRRMEAGKRAGDTAEAARADLEFRRTLYAAADNPTLLDFIDQAWLIFPFSILYGIPGRLAQSIKEHHQILDAVARRHPVEAGACIQKHLQGALEVLEEHVKRTDTRPAA
jgi:DNA-binding GntR family transcriptional regulator